MDDPYAPPVVDYPWADADIRAGADSSGTATLDVYLGASFVARLAPEKVRHVLRLMGE